jgi:hypothetical protein
MASINPINLLNGGPELLGEVADNLPPVLSSRAGAAAGQIGSNPIITEVQKLAGQTGIPGLADIVQQQSSFPYKKPVSFMLKNRDGQLLKPPAGSVDNFKDGYFFKMFVNPSNLSITEPPKTVVPIRTLGGWRVQYWYPDMGTLRADGVIGNMLERYNRDLKDSAAWRGFRKLINIYRTNGVAYLSNPSTASRISLQASFAPIAVCIFDKNQYEGYFENLEYTESEDTPHTIKYSFSFRFLNNIQLDDIPGITREAGLDASILNAGTALSRRLF